MANEGTRGPSDGAGGDFLRRILAAKREEVDALRAREAELRRRAAAADRPRDFAAALRGRAAAGREAAGREAAGGRPGEGAREDADGGRHVGGGAREPGRDTVAVIAEFKRRSPSAGALAGDVDPAVLASAYERGGAAALSVLTDGPRFGGSLEDLAAVRSVTRLPVLRKDFLLDPVQLDESRAAGADAALLIVRALDDPALARLLEGARERGMAALVEVHDDAELDRALEAGAEIVGVNARDLATFEVDVDAALELLTRVPADRIAVAESGIGGPGDAAAAGAAGADAILVGSWLVRSEDPEADVVALARAPRRPRAAAARSGGG